MEVPQVVFDKVLERELHGKERVQLVRSEEPPLVLAEQIESMSAALGSDSEAIGPFLQTLHASAELFF
jgi:hypothetical protein